jgi:hypothetical protein
MNKVLKPTVAQAELGKLIKTTSFLLAITISACNNGSSQAKSTLGTLEIDNVATVPVFANSATTTVVYIHNLSNEQINDISYISENNIAKSVSGRFTINGNSCSSIPAHGSCALEFTTPILSAKGANVQGSALIRANFMQNGKASYTQQLINYALMPAKAQISAMTNITLTSHSYGTIYLYANSGIFQLEKLTSANPQIKESNRSNNTLNAPQVVAIELTAGEISVPQNINLNLNYINQSTKNTDNLEFSVNATPTSNGPILTSGLMPIINTSESTNSYTIVYNAGNQDTIIDNITTTNGISIITASSSCLIGNTLPARGYCGLTFSVPQAGNTGTITINYNNSTQQLEQSVIWYNSKDQALLQMIINPNAVSFTQNTNSTAVNVTALNVGGYDLTNVTIPSASNPDGGSATTTLSTPLACVDSNNNSTGTTLPVNGSCTYSVTLSDTVAEANKNMLLKIAGNYTNSSGSTSYQRSIALGYTSITPPAVTITPVNSWQTMMGSAYTFIATITDGSSTVAPTITGLTGNTVSPSLFTLNSSVSGSESCMFMVTPYTGSGNYSYWNPASIANSSDINTPSNAYSYSSGSFSLTITTTNNALINNGVSPQTFSPSGSVIAPYIYLPQTGESLTAPAAAYPYSDGATYTGIPWAYSTTTTAPKPRFEYVDSGQCIKDNLTNLIWLKNPSVISASIWSTALSTAAAGTWCGQSAGTWRVPNVNELMTLMNYSTVSQSTWLTRAPESGPGFTSISAVGYWTSTTVASNISNAYTVNMSNGNISNTVIKSTSAPLLLPVRDGQ